jgi:hypothetical protein
MNYDAFSHGQIKSKLWLCGELEKHIPKNANVKILGSWYNILAFLLLARRPTHYKLIEGIDNDEGAKEIADKICNAWVIDENIVQNINDDVNSVLYHNTQIVINCSPEHMTDDAWFKKIPAGTTLCIQTSDVVDPNEPWLIKTPHPTLEDTINKYPLTITHFTGTLRIQYGDWGYNRYMIIGVK